MTDDQWTIAGILIATLALEAVLNKNLRSWLQDTLITISGAITRTDVVTKSYTTKGGPQK